MALFTISDLHLPLGVDKPMDIFGESWENYVEKLEHNWKESVKDDDTVVLPGDFSWAMHLREAVNDFKFIESLPGRKILLRGNHDYWWDTLSKLERFKKENGFESVHFLQNNYFSYGDVAICGTRFWTCPGENGLSAEDEKIYRRELIRAELTLENAKKDGFSEIIFFTHYPPVNQDGKVDDEFLKLMKKYEVKRVVYGHIHGAGKKYAFTGEYDSIKFDLVSCDFLFFLPLKLKD